MQCKILGIKGDWTEVKRAAMTTIGKEAGTAEPPSSWKRRMLLAEHSPIRKLIVGWKWTDLLSWVSVHFVRHKFGIEHWVKSQRTDRTGVDRSELTQAELIQHEAEANPQSIINISRKRLCNNASPETREAWKAVLAELEEHEPELVAVCVPDCVYRGWCYEYKSCGWHLTPEFQRELNCYRAGVNGYAPETPQNAF